MTLAVRELAYQLQHDREMAAKDRESAEKEREIQRLQLENLLLRFERRLPPAREADGPPELS